MQTWTQKIERLQSLGWSLSDLAKRIGLSVQALCDLKHGRSKEPTGMAAVRLHSMAIKRTKPRRPSTAANRAADVSAINQSTANQRTR